MSPYSMEPIRVSFLGPAASFSHQAAVECFGTSAELFPRLSFADAFAAVQQQESDYAIIPIENSTNGSVVQNFDLLADRFDLYEDVKVCGEHYLTVHHCLLAHKGWSQPNIGSITKLYTHPQAWGQCENFLTRYLKGVERQDVSSTSKAAEIVSLEPTERSGAIASHFAADYHDLQVLADRIEDKADNTTRFLVLRNVKSKATAQFEFDDVKAPSTHTQSPSPNPAEKTLISFKVRQDSPGALADALLIFKERGMNLTSINTRPSQTRAWQYIFFVECQQIPTDQNIQNVIEILHDLQLVTERCRHLGTWKDQLARVQG